MFVILCESDWLIDSKGRKEGLRVCSLLLSLVFTASFSLAVLSLMVHSSVLWSCVLSYSFLLLTCLLVSCFPFTPFPLLAIFSDASSYLLRVLLHLEEKITTINKLSLIPSFSDFLLFFSFFCSFSCSSILLSSLYSCFELFASGTSSLGGED